jgi:hypothetical protein
LSSADFSVVVTSSDRQNGHRGVDVGVTTLLVAMGPLDNLKSGWAL